MANLKTDSPLSTRIVRSFLHFLNSVEPPEGAHTEALEVAKDCLAEFFKIDQSSIGTQSTSDSLVDIFSSREESRSSLGNNGVPEAPSSSRGKSAEVSGATQSSDQDRTSGARSLGRDELFGQFVDVLDRLHFFRYMPDGNDDQSQLDAATDVFHFAVKEMQRAGCQNYDLKTLADTFKAQGNKAMQSKHYRDALQLYNLAVALCGDNAVYYCNRAAAYTQLRCYNAAVQDCLKSMEIDPNYSKAYSRLGFAYYAQGMYREAIDEGFQKALQLDPNNESVRENIRVAKQKLTEAQQRRGPGQSSTSTSHRQASHPSEGGSRSSSIPTPPPPFSMHPPPPFSMHHPPPPFSMHPPPPFSMHPPPSHHPPPPPPPHHPPPPFSMPRPAFYYNVNGFPADFSGMMMNMAGNMFPPHFQDGHEGESRSSPGNEPGAGGNMNFYTTFNEDLANAFSSMMGMFSSPNGNQQDQNNNGRFAPR